MEGLKDRAVLVKFTNRSWRGGMTDSKVSREVEKAYETKVTTGHYWKRLVPKSAISPILSAGFSAYNFHIANTLPWMEGGVRILPVANFKIYMDGMRKLIAKAEGEQKKFIKEFPQWIAEAKRTYGKLFDASQFPSAADLEHKFRLDIDVIPLPNIADWRVELDEAQVKELRRQAQAQVTAVQAEGVIELYTRLQEMLEHAKEKLEDPEAVFRDSLITNIKNMADTIARLNVTGDKNLDAVRKETEKMFKDIAPDTLRIDPTARSKAAKDARAIMRKMSGFMGTKKA